MTSFKRLYSSLGAAVAIATCIATPSSRAERPVVEGLEQIQAERMPEVLLELARRRAAEAERAPGWFKRILHRPVAWYAGQKPDPVDFRTELLADAIRIFKHFESESTSTEFDGFVTAQLAPFVASLDPKRIDDPIRHGVLTTPVAKWSMQELVVKQMVGFLGKSRDFSRRALGLISGRHLKGATGSVASIVGWTVAYQYFPDSTWSSTLFVGGLVGLALTGPFNAVTTAAAGFFVRPTTELVKVLGARITGDLEAKINRGYDWLVARLPSTGDNEHNDSVRIATFEDEHTDFARMSPEDQLRNWARGLNIFIMVYNLFSRLLRDTHHGGRDLMMLSWTDSQNISQLVEVLDVKEHVLRGNEIAVLAPYRHAMINRGEIERKNEFDRRVRAFNRVTERVWLNPDANQGEIDQLALEIDAAAERLREYGFSNDELHRLLNIQRDRGRAVGKLITAVAIGHLRQFYGAERNRNLARDAHAIAHAIQVGFGTEEYTERYLPLVRRQMRLMGMEYSDADPQSPLSDPQIVQRERCLIDSLRTELTLPAGAQRETYACINALIGYKSHADLTKDPASATARLLAQIKSHGNRLEVGGIIKYARTMLGDDVGLERKVGLALARCP